MAKSEDFDDIAEIWAEGQRRFARFVARYWADDKFRAQVLDDPTATLRRLGFDIPEDTKVRLMEAADEAVHRGRRVAFIAPPSGASTRRDSCCQAESYGRFKRPGFVENLSQSWSSACGLA